MTERNRIIWQGMCFTAASRAGCEDPCFYDDRTGKPDQFVEDDGNLHVTCNEYRAVFPIGRDMKPREFNRAVRIIMRALGLGHFIKADWRAQAEDSAPVVMPPTMDMLNALAAAKSGAKEAAQSAHKNSDLLENLERQLGLFLEELRK